MVTNRETISYLATLGANINIPYYERAWRFDGKRNPKVIRKHRPNLSISRELYLIEDSEFI